MICDNIPPYCHNVSIANLSLRFKDIEKRKCKNYIKNAPTCKTLILGNCLLDGLHYSGIQGETLSKDENFLKVILFMNYRESLATLLVYLANTRSLKQIESFVTIVFSRLERTITCWGVNIKRKWFDNVAITMINPSIMLMFYKMTIVGEIRIGSRGRSIHTCANFTCPTTFRCENIC